MVADWSCRKWVEFYISSGDKKSLYNEYDVGTLREYCRILKIKGFSRYRTKADKGLLVLLMISQSDTMEEEGIDYEEDEDEDDA
jgi:hypothetical protein